MDHARVFRGWAGGGVESWAGGVLEGWAGGAFEGWFVVVLLSTMGGRGGAAGGEGRATPLVVDGAVSLAGVLSLTSISNSRGSPSSTSACGSTGSLSLMELVARWWNVCHWGDAAFGFIFRGK